MNGRLSWENTIAAAIVRDLRSISRLPNRAGLEVIVASCPVIHVTFQRIRRCILGHLTIRGGVYRIDGNVTIIAIGTAVQPITIRAKSGDICEFRWYLANNADMVAGNYTGAPPTAPYPAGGLHVSDSWQSRLEHYRRFQRFTRC